MCLPLGCELALLVGGHKGGGETESPQCQVTLRALAGVVNDGNGGSVILLVVVLVLDEAQVDKVTHGGTGIPSDIVGVDVDLLEKADHVILVDHAGLLPGSGGSNGRGIVLVRVGGRRFGYGEGKGVCDLEEVVLIHTDNGTSSGGGEYRGAMLGNLHDDL